MSLSQLDRRWIFLAMLVVVGIPVVLAQYTPIVPSPLVLSVFDKIESLPPGSRVVMSLDCDPSSAAELNPMTIALLRHCCEKRHRIVVMTLWPTGLSMIEQMLRQVIEQEYSHLNLKSGVDYVFLGYRPGQEVVIKAVSTDLLGLYKTDSENAETASMPIFAGMRGIRDAELLVNISAGFPGAREWVQYAATTHKIPFAVGCTGVQTPQLYPYIPNQILGLLAAIKGAAEYESALATRYPNLADPQKNSAGKRMGPQVWAHRLIVGLILAANVLHFASRRKARG